MYYSSNALLMNGYFSKIAKLLHHVGQNVCVSIQSYWLLLSDSTHVRMIGILGWLEQIVIEK